MKIDVIIDAIIKVMGVTKEDLFDPSVRSRSTSLARQIFAHIYLETGASAMTLAQESRISPTAWRKARYALTAALAENSGIIKTYKQVYKMVYPNNVNKIKLIPTLGPKWTENDNIRIERAMRSSLLFMKNYGRAR